MGGENANDESITCPKRVKKMVRRLVPVCLSDTMKKNAM